MLKKLILLGVAAGALFAVAATASADHAGTGHWSNLSPKVYNGTKATMYNVPAAVQEWNDLGAPIQMTMATKSTAANIVISESKSGPMASTSIRTDGSGHITKVTIKLNTNLLRGFPQMAADHALCRELGRALGLTYTVGNTCMNNTVDLQYVQFPAPNGHDGDQLDTIYGHAD